MYGAARPPWGGFFVGCCSMVLASVWLDAQPPALTTISEVHYPRRDRPFARATNPASVTAQQRGMDNGIHGAVRHVKEPLARTATDCEHAALAVLDDGAIVGWTGEYNGWNDFLPGNAQDIFPGDALSINMPSRGSGFSGHCARSGY
jgi:hypothetical protein